MRNEKDTGSVVVNLQRAHIPPVALPIDGGHTPLVGSPEAISLTLGAGQVAGLSGLPGSGLTTTGLALLAPHAVGGPIAYVDVRGWANPAAAWEIGIPPERIVVVRNGDVVTWGRVVAALLSGTRGVYAEVPKGVRDEVLRKLAAKARTQRTPIVLRPIDGVVPSGIATLRIEARAVEWEGTDAGHGRLMTRRMVVEVSGKSVQGMRHTIEMEGHGTDDLRVVSHVGVASSRRPA